MIRPLAIALLCCALWGAPAFASDALEARVAEVERLSVSAHWRVSAAKLRELAPMLAEFAPGQRQRLEYVRLRNLGLSGAQVAALDGMGDLLREDLSPALRLRIYATGISMAANVEDWPLAFAWLNDGLAVLPEAPEQSAGLLGVASYLHALVGEHRKALDLALQALAAVEPGVDPRPLCLAIGDVALAEDHAGNHAAAESWRRRQIDACRRAGDLTFLANAKYGVGKMAAAQGRHAEALDWARQALAEFEASGFTVGAWSARLVLAGSLVALGQDLDEADALLTDTLRYYQGQESDRAIAETEHQLARLAERLGDADAALVHTRRAVAATAAAERDAHERRLAYLQVEFDTRLKEQQIALLEAEREVAALQVEATRRRQLLLWAGLSALLLTAILLSALLRHSLRERRRYRWLSEHDSLTGLYNYQQVRRRGEEAFAAARAGGRPFTAIVADIDRFKDVNDRHGHAAGDQALRSLGSWITEVVGGRGIAGRSGGDEFTVLLEDDADGAEALLHRLRERIEPITVFGQTFRIALSSGICQDTGRAASLEQLIHEADRSLYRAKHDGRDRVVRAEALGGPAGLVVVGSGIQFGRHASERCLSEIREAEVVLCLVDPVTLGMIHAFRPDAVNLGLHYVEGRDRRETYRAIDAAIMAEVRAGRRVCAVFYGHPGVFADVPHAVVRKARAEGLPARMEPGISAEACLYADLGIDPGRHGVQSLEATQFLVHEREPDPAGVLLLWQVALAGDLSCTRFHAEPEGLQALVDRLLRWYPAEHEVILYEAARLPIEEPRAERLSLRGLPAARYQEYTTLVVPPAAPRARVPA